MANRKLQTEIERTLKKVSEGLDIFHETLEKLDSATTPAQKEKVEVELKKEIKKLQRLRDLIKNWQTMSEIKDKSTINDARRLIEMEMERFKVLEKEMKIKAYSKEGLSQAAKMDPKEQEKFQVSQWINGIVDKLGTQRDAFEAELESLQIQSRKSKRLEGGKQERLDSLPRMIERHKMHIRKLEQLLRMMENDKITVEEITRIKEDVEYYVESNQDPDFVPDEDLYDQFEFNDELSDSDAEEGDDGMADDGIGYTVTASSPPTAISIASGHHVHTIDSTKDMTRKGVIGGEKPQLNSQASVVAPVQGTPGTTAKKVSNTPLISQLSKASPTINMPVILPPAPGGSSVSIPPAGPTIGVVAKVSGPSFASAIATGAATGKSSTTASTGLPARPQSPPRGIPSIDLRGKLNKNKPSPALSLPGPYGEFNMVLKRRQDKLNQSNQNELYPALEQSWQSCPDGSETERSKTFWPKQPLSIPSYYPSFPPAILENPAIFERFELDTLFFIFYYQQRSYAQYFAARELKRQSWRFHKKYLTWFQRHEEPKTITEEFEQGTYIYFDYEGSWCQRKKSEFTFEYRYLEDEETI